MKVVNIAGLNISIDTSNYIGKMIANDLGAKKKEESEIDININFNKINLNYEVTSGNNFKFNENEFFYKSLYPIKYKVSNICNKDTTKIYIEVMKKNLKSRFKSLFVNSKEIEKNTILSYSLFWYILQLKLLNNNKTFLHAGIFSKNNKAIAITGVGGSGKTSGLFKILEDKKYKYLAEDFGIIDNNLNTYYNPKPLSIYETDIKFNPEILNKVYDYQNIKQQLVWNVQTKFFKINPIIKINPKQLLGDQISLKSHLTKVLYFMRTSTKEIIIHNISSEELAERSLNVALREFKIFFEIFTLLNANKKQNYEYLTIDNIIQIMKNLYIDIFSKTENYLIEIPFNYIPENIINFLKQKGIIE